MASFDSETKEWSGGFQPTVLNPEASLGQILLNFLSRVPGLISQINSANWEEMTAKEIQIRTIRIAQNLLKMGYKKGDIFAILTQNNDNLAPLVYAGFCIGASIHLMDPKSSGDDVLEDFKIVRPTIVFCDMGHLEKMEEATKHVGIEPKIFVFESSINELLKSTGTEHLYVAQYMGDTKELVAFIANTSDPKKKVCISQAQLVEQNNAFKYPDAERLFCTSPLDRVPSLISIVKCVFDGMTRIIHRETLTPETILNIISKQKISLLITSVETLETLSNCSKIGEVDLSSVKFIDSYGGFLPEKLKQNIETWLLNGKVCFGYGHPLKGGYVATDFHVSKEGSSGVLIPNMKGQILNNDGIALGVGETGQICLKSDCRFLGFLNDDLATKELLTDDGWIKTGDFGFFDDEGFLFIAKKDDKDGNNNNLEEATEKLTNVIEAECLKREILSENTVHLLSTNSSCQTDAIQEIQEDQKVPEIIIVEKTEDETVKVKKIVDVQEDLKNEKDEDEEGNQEIQKFHETEGIEPQEVEETMKVHDPKSFSEIKEEQTDITKDMIQLKIPKIIINDVEQSLEGQTTEKECEIDQKISSEVHVYKKFIVETVNQSRNDDEDDEIAIPKSKYFNVDEFLKEIAQENPTELQDGEKPKIVDEIPKAFSKIDESPPKDSIPASNDEEVIIVQPKKSSTTENIDYMTDESDPESLLDSLTKTDIVLETAKNSKVVAARKSMDRKKSIPMPTIPEDKSLDTTNANKKKDGEHSDGCCCCSCSCCVIA